MKHLPDSAGKDDAPAAFADDIVVLDAAEVGMNDKNKNCDGL